MTHPDAEFLALQTALAGEYSLQRELGRGGMGIVYLARDVQLDRDVAIKVLPSHLASAAWRARNSASGCVMLYNAKRFSVRSTAFDSCRCTQGWARQGVRALGLRPRGPTPTSDP